MVWRIAVGLLVVGFVVFLFTLRRLKAAPPRTSSRGDNGRSACGKSGQGESRVCRRMLLGNAIGV